MHDPNPHGKPVEQLANELGTHLEQGLAPREAQARLAAHGANELTERPRPGLLALLAQQFNNYLVLILVAAALVSMALGEWVDSIAILVIVVLNAAVGVVQESRAEKALEALRRMSAPSAQVVRGGEQVTVPGRELVPGDIVRLEAGNFVPADVRLVETHRLKVEEASLTGESVPVDKDAALLLDADIPLGDRRNTAFMGTLVTNGRATGLVTATGMATQIGLIAEMIQSFEAEQTPLQRKLAQLGKVLGTASLAICAVVFVYGLFRDANLATALDGSLAGYLEAQRAVIVNLFMTAVSLAIAAVPEGLPAIVTICLALGMQRMIRHHALIRRLPAVETLGCATVVCSDKTGTLTQNEMTVVRAWAGGRSLRVTGEGYAPQGRFLENDEPFEADADPDARALLVGAAACNDAKLAARDDDGGRAWRILGDPTEGAMVVAAAKGGVRQDELAATLPREQELPFDAERKRMTTLHANRGGWPVAHGAQPFVAITKGAPDLVLGLSTHVMEDGRAVPLTAALRRAILDANHAMAADALRVLAVAFRPLEALPGEATPEAIERDLVFAGLVGMIDPPRPEVIPALATARAAGLRTVMVTGDYKDTAEAVARQIGLRTAGGVVLTGPEIEAMSDEDLAREADRLEVCCRVSPQHKTRIVSALRARGHVVAMTGDGVNDAPALKRADIGVAMGVTGTDVARQTADMVLTDDNFASIVAAIEQGRIIYANIRKFVYFLLACNVGEILIVFGAMLVGLPIPLRPVQLLWLNLVSDGAPALALGLEKGDPDVMRHPPRSPREPVVNRDMALGIAVVGLVDAVAILAVFHLALLRHPGSLEAAQTIAFVTLSTSELLRAFAARSETHGAFSIGLFSNRWMVWAVAASFLLVLAAVYLPFLRPFFDAVPPGADDWLLMLPFLFASPVAMEILKLYFRARQASREAAARAPDAPRGDAPGAPDDTPHPDGGKTMLKVLVPVDGSRNDEFAARRVARLFLEDSAMEVHLLNVQAPFSRDVAHFVSRRVRGEYHHERSAAALLAARSILEAHGIPYAVHEAVGERAQAIADAARRLRCGRIVMATARKNSLTRLVEGSVVNRVLQLATVPVEVVAGEAVSPLERWGIPAALAALAALVLAMDD